MSQDSVPTYSSDLPLTKPPLAVASIILSMSLIAVGAGLMVAYIPIRLVDRGFDPSVPGWILTATSVGGFFACVGTGHIVRRVGHARAFMSLVALMVLSHLAIAATEAVWVWLVARMGYGLSIAGVFIIAQSWLNDACPNNWRGRVMAAFYMSYILCIGVGGFLVGQVDLTGSDAPIVAIAFATLAILPIGMTNLRAPLPPESVSVAFRAVWKISPVGLMGLLAAGGLTMMVQGFAPLYAKSEGFTQSEIGLLLFLMQFGMIFVQMPLGALSDRIDRRIVLVLTSALVAVFAGIATQSSGIGLWPLIVLFGLWAGAGETVYAVSNAHANDRADPQYYVSLSMTMLFAWSVSAVVMPGIASALTQVIGVTAYMYVALVIAVIYGLFVLYRMTRREAVVQDDQEAYEPLAGQAAYSPELLVPASADEVKQKDF